MHSLMRPLDGQRHEQQRGFKYFSSHSAYTAASFPLTSCTSGDTHHKADISYRFWEHWRCVKNQFPLECVLYWTMQQSCLGWFSISQCHTCKVTHKTIFHWFVLSLCMHQAEHKLCWQCSSHRVLCSQQITLPARELHCFSLFLTSNT